MSENNGFKQMIKFDVNTIWNSLLLVTIITLLISTREDIASIGTILHEREAKFVALEEKVTAHDKEITDLKVRVGGLENTPYKINLKK